MRTVFLMSIEIAAVVVLSVGAQRQNTDPTPATKFGVQVRPGPMDSILLKDYTPSSSLVVPETQVQKARVQAIDVRTHTGQSSIRNAEDVAAWVRTMDEVGVETTVVFTGATGAEFDRQAELFKPYANRFQLCCSLEGGDVGAHARAVGCALHERQRRMEPIRARTHTLAHRGRRRFL